MTIDEQVGARIKAKRKQRKFTHSDTARILRCSESQVMRYENGETSVKPQTLITLAEMFFCKPSHFLDGIDVQ